MASLRSSSGRALYQLGYSVADEHRIYAQRMGLEAHSLQRMVGGIGQIAYGVEQSAVEIKYHKSFHNCMCIVDKLLERIAH